MESLSEHYAMVASYREGREAGKQACIDELAQMIEDAEGIHSEAWVNGLKAALERIKDFA